MLVCNYMYRELSVYIPPRQGLLNIYLWSNYNCLLFLYEWVCIIIFLTAWSKQVYFYFFFSKKWCFKMHMIISYFLSGFMILIYTCTSFIQLFSQKSVKFQIWSENFLIKKKILYLKDSCRHWGKKKKKGGEV